MHRLIIPTMRPRISGGEERIVMVLCIVPKQERPMPLRTRMAKVAPYQGSHTNMTDVTITANAPAAKYRPW